MDFFTDEYLEHHGIRGQKWGVRRYQNPDGSLTERGKKRVARLNAAVDKKYEKSIKSVLKKAYDANQKDAAAMEKQYYKDTARNRKRYAKAALNREQASDRRKFKIDYEKKLRDIRKSEIRNGFNYMENARNRDLLITGLISEYGGIGLSVYDTVKYHEGYRERKAAKKQHKETTKRFEKDAKKNKKEYLNAYEKALFGN